jgi:hypothetical protein
MGAMQPFGLKGQFLRTSDIFATRTATRAGPRAARAALAPQSRANRRGQRGRTRGDRLGVTGPSDRRRVTVNAPLLRCNSAGPTSRADRRRQFCYHPRGDCVQGTRAADCPQDGRADRHHRTRLKGKSDARSIYCDEKLIFSKATNWMSRRRTGAGCWPTRKRWPRPRDTSFPHE